MLLEITKPSNRVAAVMFKFYFGGIYPWFTRMLTRSKDAEELMKYYWETMEACVPPEPILQALRRAGFCEVKRDSRFGLLSEYTGVKN